VVELSADASELDTVVEVHADDDIGLLYRLASVFAELDLDVRVAKVATLGSRVVDAFYVRDANDKKVVDPAVKASVRAALEAHLTG
jgi:[protein-PII] uridylyltransferase